MWVLTGPFDGKESDEPQPHKSKLLKTGKTYTVGRKDQSLIIRHKKISREHARFVVGECSEEDAVNPEFVPTLSIEVIKSGKKLAARNMDRIGEQGPVVLNPGESKKVQDGDVVHMVTGAPVTVRWQKLCCYSPKGTRSLSLQTCASLGIHVVPTLLPDVTHHLTPTFTLSPELAVSLISVATIVKPEWLSEVLRLGESAEGTPSKLEETFALPPTTKYRPSFSPSLPVALKSFGKWEPNESRVGIFRNYRFIFLGEKGREVQDAMRALIKRGEGEYECFAVQGGRRAWHQVLSKGKSKERDLILVADEGTIIPAVGRDGWQELVDEARSFDLRIVPRDTILTAVVHADTTFITSALVEDSAHQKSASPLPDIVPNTHPDEPSVAPELPPVVSLRRLPRRATSRASSRAPSPPAAPSIALVAEPSEVPEAPKPQRTLVRRARKAKTPIIGLDDPSFDLDGDSVLGSAAPIVIESAEEERPPRSTEAPSATPARPRLKRRAGTTQAPPSLFYGLQEDLLIPEAEEPPLKKFKALFEESDPDRVAQSGSAMDIKSGQSLALPESVTQSESGTTQIKPRSRPDHPTALAALVEEEEESIGGTASRLDTTSSAFSQGLKRKSQMMDDDVEIEEVGPSRKRRTIEDINAIPSSTSQTTVRSPSHLPKDAPSQKSEKPTGAAPGKPDTDEAFLKAVSSTKRGKKAEDTFDREFNNLRISKPDLEKDEEQKGWALLEEFGDDGDMRGNFMVIVEMEVYRKSSELQALRVDQGRSDWEGRPNFKKFKKKFGGGRHQAVELYAAEEDDYGVGSQYWKGSSQKPSHLQSQSQSQSQKPKSDAQTQRKGKSRAIDVDDSDEDFKTPQTGTLLTSQSRAPSTQSSTARTRRTQIREKSQPLFIDSDIDEEGHGKLELPSDSEFVDEAKFDKDFDDPPLRSTVGRTQGSSKRQSSRATAAKKVAAPVIVDDDSDDGATFRGFGANKKGRRK